jgi:hypothetical protein
VRFALLCIFLYLFVPRAVWPHRAPPWHLNNSKRSDLKLANSKWSKTWFRLATNLQAFVAFRSPIFHSGWQVTIQIWILDRVQFLPCCKNAGSTRDLPCVGTDVFSSYTIFTCKPILLLSKFHHRLMMHLCTYDFFCSADTCRIIVLFIAVSSKLDWVRFYIGSPALAHGFRMNPQGEKSSIIWVYHAYIGGQGRPNIRVWFALVRLVQLAWTFAKPKGPNFKPNTNQFGSNLNQFAMFPRWYPNQFDLILSIIQTIYTTALKPISYYD